VIFRAIERALTASLDEQMALSLAIESAQAKESQTVSISGASTSSSVGVFVFSSALGSMGLGAFTGGARSRASAHPAAIARRGVYVETAEHDGIYISR
jgi:hypothetical protein